MRCHRAPGEQTFPTGEAGYHTNMQLDLFTTPPPATAGPTCACGAPARYRFPSTGTALCNGCYAAPGEIRIGWEDMAAAPAPVSASADTAVHTRGQGGEGIHLRRPQHDRPPGLVEGTDYPVATACCTGAYHIRFTNDRAKVTCPACLKTQPH